MTLATHLKTASEQFLGSEYFVVDVHVGQGKPPKVKVVLDGDHGASIEACSRLSHKITPELDTYFENFSLEVTSPGLDQPLTMLRQYKKNMGREVNIQLTDSRTLVGVLTACTESEVELLVSPKKNQEATSVNIPFSEIEKTCVQVSFKKVK